MPNLESLPDSARIWIFAFGRTLEAEEVCSLSERMEQFTSSWEAHGALVPGGFEILRDRFLIAGADHASVQVSGCSIDGLFREVKEVVSRIEVPLADPADVFYLKDDAVQQCNRLEFRTLAEQGELTRDTLVFDTAVLDLNAVRQGNWECKRSESWHEKLV